MWYINHLDFPPSSPASLRRLYLRPTPRAYIYRHVPHLFVPTLPPSACSKVHVVPWSVCLSFSPLSILCLRLSIPVWFTDSWYLLVFGISILGWSLSRKGKGPGRLLSLAVALHPPCYAVIPELFRLSGLT